MSDDAVVLDGAETADLRQGSVAGGHFLAYTCRSPEKTTLNEDTVAIIPYGAGAVVLVVADGAGGLPAGRRASQTAVTSLIDSLRAAAGQTMLLRNAILNGIEAANAVLRSHDLSTWPLLDYAPPEPLVGFMERLMLRGRRAVRRSKLRKN